MEQRFDPNPEVQTPDAEDPEKARIARLWDGYARVKRARLQQNTVKSAGRCPQKGCRGTLVHDPDFVMTDRKGEPLQGVVMRCETCGAHMNLSLITWPGGHTVTPEAEAEKAEDAT